MCEQALAIYPSAAPSLSLKISVGVLSRNGGNLVSRSRSKIGLRTASHDGPDYAATVMRHRGDGATQNGRRGDFRRALLKLGNGFNIATYLRATLMTQHGMP